MKAICIGHIAYDTTFKLDNFPEENTKTRVSSHVEGGGGPSGNAAYLLGSWGLDVDICGAVGNDYQGNNIIEEFKRVGVNTKYIKKYDSAKTDQAFILANTMKKTRTIVSSVAPRDDKIIYIDDNYDGILVDGEEFLTSKKVLDENPDALSIIDAGRFCDNTVALAHKVKIMACSKEFAEKFTGQKININDLEKLTSIYRVLETEFKNIVIITLEEHGAFTRINNEYKIVPSIKVNAIDSTGAGDMFHGALLYFLLYKYTLEDAIRLSNIAGALTTTHLGNRDDICLLSEVLKYGGFDDII